MLFVRTRGFVTKVLAHFGDARLLAITKLIGVRIRERFVGKAAIMRLEGSLKGPAATSVLEKAFRRHAEAGRQLLIVDLRDVPVIGSDGLAALIDGGRSIIASGGRLRLSGLTRRIEDQAVIASLLGEFDAFEFAEDALDRFVNATRTARAFPRTRSIPTRHAVRQSF